MRFFAWFFAVAGLGVGWGGLELGARPVVTAPLAASELLPPAQGVTHHEWSEERSSFIGGRVLAWDEVPAQVYASVVGGKNALRRKEDAVLLPVLEPGPYTVHVRASGAGGAREKAGTVLVEVYELP